MLNNTTLIQLKLAFLNIAHILDSAIGNVPNSADLGAYARPRVVRTLSERQKKVLEIVAKETHGISTELLHKRMRRLGYKKSNVYGGYLKGQGASLVKIPLPQGGYRIKVSDVGRKLLEQTKIRS